MDKSKKSFHCEYCSEIFSTKQNKNRHITRKHKPERTEEDNISVLSQSTESEENPMEYLLDVPDVPKPLPTDEYLINLRNEYMKYEHLYPALDKKMKWEKANVNVDLNYDLKKHSHKMTYILVDVRDAKLPI